MKTREQLESELLDAYGRPHWGRAEVVDILDKAGLLLPEGWGPKRDEHEWLGGPRAQDDVRKTEQLLSHALIGYDSSAETLPELAQEVTQALRTAEDARLECSDEVVRLNGIINKLRAGLEIKTNVEHDEYLAMIERRFKAVRDAVAK